MTVLGGPVHLTIDGLDLTTYSLQPSGLTAIDEFPVFRGENPVRGGRTGRAYLAKTRDSRRFRLGIKINPKDADGSVTGTAATQVRTNQDALNKILAASGQRTIVRYMPDATTRTALGEVMAVDNIVDPFGFGTLRLIWVEFDLADPYWYGAAVTPSATTINASPKAISVTNAGTVPTSRLSFSCVGPLTDVAISNTTTGERLATVQVVAAAKILAIDCDTGIVTYDGTAIPSLVSHTGGVGLLTLAAGVNALSVTSSVITTGTVTPTHYPAFL